VLRVVGKGTKVVLVPLPPAVGRAIDQTIGERTHGPILLNRHGTRMDRHAATRRLRHLTKATSMRIPKIHPHVMRHFRDHHARRRRQLPDVQIAARHADPAPPCATTAPARASTAHPNYILAAEPPYVVLSDPEGNRFCVGGHRRDEGASA
jgi:integrase/recombinase XerD